MAAWETFGRLLSKYLREQDISPTDLAKRLEINSSTTNRWSNGETRPKSPEVVIQIADVLRVPQNERPAFLTAAGYGYIEHNEASDSSAELQISDKEIEASAQAEPTPVEVVKSAVNEDARAELAENPSAGKSATVSAPDLGNPTKKPESIGWADWLRQNRRITQSLGMILIALFFLLGASIVFPKPQIIPFALGKWKVNLPITEEKGINWGAQIRQQLYSKLNQVAELQGIYQAEEQIPARIPKDVTIWIEGQLYREAENLVLLASLYRQQQLEEMFKAEVIYPNIQEDGNAVCLLDLENQLVKQILSALQIVLEEDQLSKIDRIPTSSCQALRLNNQATEHIEQGELEAAELLLRSALQLDTNYADAYSNLALLYMMKGQNDMALAEVQRAIAANPTIPDNYFLLADLYIERGDYRDANQLYQTWQPRQSTDFDVLNNWGYSLYQLKEYDAAFAKLQIAVQLEADSPFVYKNLGCVYWRKNQYQEAVQSLHKALDLYTQQTGGEPFNDALFCLAGTYHNQGNLDKACELWQQYVTNGVEVAEVQSDENLSAVENLLKTEKCKG